MKGFFFLLVLFPLFSSAQCISGNCKDGKGKFDFGYAVYEGDFKNGKPHGQGTMDYGGGEKYVGSFANGAENGKGILYKGDTQKEVTYLNGQLVVQQKQTVAIGANAIQYDGGMECTGNCFDGQGTARFPSGNVYTGNFKNGLFHGMGKMVFAGGNVLDGLFENHQPKSGSFTYAADGVVFTGTFNKDGSPASGTYNSKQTGGLVQINNGTIIKVSNPRLDSIRAAQPKYKEGKCSLCKGQGFFTSTTTTSQQLTAAVYQSHSSGVADLIHPAQSITSKHTSFDKCKACNGTGTVMVQQK